MYVYKIKHILSVIHYTICGVLCFQFAHLIPMWWLGEYISFVLYYHHQIGGMNPMFRVSSWNNDMRCMSFYILGNNVIEFERLYVSYKQNPSCEHVSKILSFVFFCPMLQRKSRSQVLSAIRSNIGLSPSYSKGQDPAACILICSRQLLYCSSTFAAGEYL